MGLMKSQIDIVQAYASKNIKACHNCKRTLLSVGDVVPASTHVPGAAQLSGKNVTMVQIVCMDCGYVHLFSTLCVGIPEV